MQPETLQLLTLAFSQLDKFSIPEVGLFTKEYQKAVFDHQHKKVSPPREAFQFDPDEGKTHVQPLVDLYSRILKLDLSTAETLVRKLSRQVLQLTQNEELVIPGAGTLKHSVEHGFSFEPAAQDANKGAFFGLNAVGFEAASSPKAVQEKVNLSSGTPVVVMEKKRKKRRVWPILLILLLVAVSGYFFRDELKSQLMAWGVISDDSTKTTEVAEGTAADQDTLAAATVPVDTTKQPDEPSQSVVSTPNTSASSSLTVNEPKENIASSFSGAVTAEKGVFYLVVSSESYGETASKKASEIKKQGINARVISSPGKGYYKVVVYSSSDKREVIQKMVAWKEKFSASWIYWVGM